MGSIVDDRGYNQSFRPTKALEVRTERRCLMMIQEMCVSPDSKILELGCSTGTLSWLLARKTGAKVLGVDLCADFIFMASEKYKAPNLEFRALDLNRTDLYGALQTKFDYVVGNGILHHLYRGLDTTMLQLKGILNPSGKIIFMEPNLWNPYVYLIFSIGMFRRLAKLEPDETAFTSQFIRRKLIKLGYSNVKVELRDFLLPNTPDFIIKPTVKIGKVMERIPGVRRLAQSLFICASAE